MSTWTSAEHLGHARVYLNTIIAASNDQKSVAAVRKLTKPIIARVMKKPNLRPEHFIDVVREWKNLRPEDTRLKFEASYSKKGFRICEVFIAPVIQELKAQGNLETSVGIWEAIVRSGNYGDSGVQPVATICLHAIARWLQRNTDQSLAAFRRDIAVLMCVTQPNVRRVRTPDGGYWWGGYDVAKIPNQPENWNPIFKVRTFYSAPMIGLKVMEDEE